MTNESNAHTPTTNEELLQKLQTMIKDANATYRKGKVKFFTEIKSYIESYGTTGLEKLVKERQATYGARMQFEYTEACKDVLNLIRD